MSKEFHIGDLILQVLKEKERSIAWLARHINCDGGNLSRLLKNNAHIHSELLLRISKALRHDFFIHYSAFLHHNGYLNKEQEIFTTEK